MRNLRPHRHPAFSRTLADFVGAAIDPVLARQGFGQSDIILFWDEIVGERLASMSEPLCLRWPPRGRNRTETGSGPATLVVRVETGFALELQYHSALVIERINTHLGFACVGRISLKQGPLAHRRTGRPVYGPPTSAAMAAAASRLTGIDDDALRLALTRLGARVIDSQALHPNCEPSA